jgi:hypothetical protein
MAGRRLRLTRKAVTQVLYQHLGAYRLRIEVSDPENTGADPYVFLYLRRPVNPYNQEVLDDFHAVASPVDLAEYPVGEPNALTTYPFYRLDFIELDFRSTDQATDTWVLIVAEVDALLKALDRLEALEIVAEVTVGNPADTGNSSSRSQSNSNSNSG